MSALGQKQTSRHLQSMSALPPKADIAQTWARFICVPDRLSTPAVPPTGRLKRELVGRSEKVIRQGLIVQGPGYGHSANAESDQHHRLIACGASLQIRLEDFNHRLGYLAVRRFNPIAVASSIGRQCDQRTGSFDVLQVIARQVGVDDRPSERTSGHVLRWPLLPALGHLLAQEVSYRFSVELL